MEQHPIPQQISSYQFKLVGDMTLKQFFQLAGGVVVSLIFYSLPFHFLIKWPLIIFSAGLGAAMAFLPFQERPLEKWIIAFFRSIYSPTLYSWKKGEKLMVFLSEDANTPVIGNVPTGQTVAEPNAKKLEEAEKNFLSKLTSLIQTNSNVQVPKVQSVQTQPIPNNTQVANNQSSVNITVPQQIPTVVTKTAPKLIVEESVPYNRQSEQQVFASLTTEPLKEKTITSDQVEFSIDAAPPFTPTIPNTVSGQVIDQDRKIVEGAILEIKDAFNKPVRAIKSNKAGHFLIVTPLINGKYEISTEKEGFEFKTVSFEAKGEIVPAIAIKGNRL